MAEHEGGQWNVATKDNSVYLERVSNDDERLFDDSLEPHEARQLARLLTKFADKLDDSGAGPEEKHSEEKASDEKASDENQEDAEPRDESKVSKD